MICNHISTWMNQWTLKICCMKYYQLLYNATNVYKCWISSDTVYHNLPTKSIYKHTLPSTPTPIRPIPSTSTKFPPHPPRCMLLVVISREPRCFTICNRCKALLHGALLSTLHRCTKFGRKPWSSCSNLSEPQLVGTIIGWWIATPEKNVWTFVGRYHLSTV